MSNYIKKRIHLSDNQISKLKLAYKNSKEISLQIDKNKPPNYDMYLTQTQIKHIANGKRIKISMTQLKKNGGFLPFLIPILIAGAKALAIGATSGAAGWVAKKGLDKISGSGKPKKKKNGSGYPPGLTLDDIANYKKKKSRGKGVYQPWEYPTK